MKYPVREIDRSEEIFLEIIAEKLEEDISNYEVQVLEEVFDEDSNRVFWVFEFDRGTKIHSLVISLPITLSTQYLQDSLNSCFLRLPILNR